MNVHIFCVHLSLMLLLQHDLAKTLPEAEDDEIIGDETGDDVEALHEAHHKAIKHTKVKHMKKHNRNRRAEGEASNTKMQCAIMYKDDQPVGILQPFENSYQFLPVEADAPIPVDITPIETAQVNNLEKRQANEITDGAIQAVAEFSDEKYPSIFAKFKIDSKVEKEDNQKIKSMQKRELGTELISEKHQNSLSSTLSRIQTNDESAEAELKGILNDMGLIDASHIDKRDAEIIEDEDLEHGDNKINIIKIDTNENGQRDKREKSSKVKNEKSYGIISIPEPKSLNEDEYVDQYMMKHPEEFAKKERERRSETIAEQMEKQIKERLQKIKEEVKTEIEKIRSNTDSEEINGKEEEEVSDEKSQRKKRNVMNTLVEEETSDLDPILIGDNNLIPHIRRRRSLNEDDSKNRNVPTFSNPTVLRHLQSYTGYDDSNNFDNNDEENENEATREKKACKCIGKECKCSNQPKQFAAAGGADILYLDGAPVAVNEPLQSVQKQSSDYASMKFIPARKKRPSRENSDVKLGQTRKQLLKGLKNGGYILDLYPDIYNIMEQKENSRQKRNSFENLLAVHGGGPILRHLVAVRERSMLPRIRMKRKAKSTDRQLTLTDLPEEDLFGAMPQSFEGELARFKRI